MKKIILFIFSTIFIISIIVFLLIMNRINIKNRSNLYCSNLEVLIRDSSKYSFVEKNDVKNLLKNEYGQFIGQKLDSVNTKKIEEILNNKNSILNCVAYTTNDGILHIEIYQRKPILRYNNGVQDYFIDEMGYVFPAKCKLESPIPLITGDYNITDMVKNNNLTDKERYWITNLIGMIKYINDDRYWKKFVKEIKVDKDGNISFIPSIGKEIFFIGYPDKYKEKFKRIEDYYKYIVVEKGPEHYKFVNVKYQNQIICK